MYNLKNTLKNMVNKISTDGENILSLALYQDGEWALGSAQKASPFQNSYSITKTFTTTIVGIAIDRGLLSPQDKVISFFENDVQKKILDNMKDVTVHHLMNNTTGIEKGFLFESDRYTHGTDDWLSLCLSQPLKYEPGTHFTYSNSNFYLLSRIVAKVTNQSMQSFGTSNLLQHLGIKDHAWGLCPKGHAIGATGLYLTSEGIAKLGLLYLNDGVYEGKQVISSNWCKLATQSHSKSSRNRDYGYGIWINGNDYSFEGSHGQIVIIRPKEKLIFAAHSFLHGYGFQEYDFQDFLDSCLE